MKTNKENLMEFLSLFNEEDVKADPFAYLVELWNIDKQSCRETIRNTISLFSAYRGMDVYICNFLMRVKDALLIEELERHVARDVLSKKVNTNLLITLMLLGSRKTFAVFKDRLENIVTMSLDSKEYDDAIVTSYLKVIAFLKSDEFNNVILKLYGKAGEQYHRAAKFPPFYFLSKPFTFRKENNLKKWDSSAIKYSEAILTLSQKGQESIMTYLDTIDNREARAYEYLYCLACQKNPENYDYFYKYYKGHSRIDLKCLCVEGLFLSGTADKITNFISTEISNFNYDNILNSKSVDMKILVINRYDKLFYFLLCISAFLEKYNKQIIDNITKVISAKDVNISSMSKYLLSTCNLNKQAQKYPEKDTIIQKIILQTDILAMDTNYLKNLYFQKNVE